MTASCAFGTGGGFLLPIETAGSGASRSLRNRLSIPLEVQSEECLVAEVVRADDWASDAVLLAAAEHRSDLE